MLEPDAEQRDRRSLAETLRQLRDAAGLSGERLAVRTAMSQSKISRIESGRIVPTVADTERIMRALDVPRETREELLSLARAANIEYTSLRSSARVGIWRRQAEIKSLVDSSSVVRQFLPAAPSGLLQTREYARAALTPGVEGRPARDVERAVRARLERQGALNDESRRFRFLLTEQAVRTKRAEPAVMVDQLHHMIEVANLRNVELAVLSDDALVRASPLNVFVVYDDRLVTAELFSGSVALRDHRDVTYHLNLFAHFRERALVGKEARQLLVSIAEEYRGT